MFIPDKLLHSVSSWSAIQTLTTFAEMVLYKVQKQIYIFLVPVKAKV